MDYIRINLLKAMCDLATERAACGNCGRKVLETLAVWFLKRCRKEARSTGANERGSWREEKLEKEKIPDDPVEKSV